MEVPRPGTACLHAKDAIRACCACLRVSAREQSCVWFGCGGSLRDRRRTGGDKVLLGSGWTSSRSIDTGGLTAVRSIVNRRRACAPASARSRPAREVLTSPTAFGNQTISAAAEGLGPRAGVETHGFASLPRGRFAIIVYNRCLRKNAPPGGSQSLKPFWPMFVNGYFFYLGRRVEPARVLSKSREIGLSLQITDLPAPLSSSGVWKSAGVECFRLSWPFRVPHVRLYVHKP